MGRLLVILGLCVLGLTAAGLMVGEVPIDLAMALSDPHSADGVIVWQIRWPRTLLALLVGAALGLSGASLQALTRNPLADPGLLGVSSVAGLGAVLALSWGAAGLWAISAAALSGAGVALAVLLLAAGALRQITALVLFGVGLSALAGALTALVFNIAPNPMATADMLGWLMGSVAHRDLRYAGVMAVAVLVAGAVLAAVGRDLRLLQMGESVAISMGLSLRRLRMGVLLATTLLTGASVAVAGVVGFVGLAAGHLVRPLCGGDPVRSLAPAALMGAVLVGLADLAVRRVPTDQELKLGVMTALIGAPVLCVLAARLAQRGGIST